MESGKSRTNHNQPFRLLDTFRVRLGISERLPFRIFGFFDLITGAVTDEYGLASPFDDDLGKTHESAPGIDCHVYRCISYVLALGNSAQVDLNLGLSQNICGCGHAD